MSTNKRQSNRISGQEGIATLATAVVLMLAVFGVSFMVSNVVIRDKQVAVNNQRALEAFQAAQSGIDYAVAYINTETLNSVYDETEITNPLILSSGAVSPYTSAVLPYASVTISASSVSFTLRSEGVSKDGTVSRVITTQISGQPADPEPPAVPVVAKGGLTIKGNLDVTNNEESLTIWSGEAADLGGSAATYISIDGVEDQLSTTGTTRGPDVVEFDSNLEQATESELLQSFFNRSSFEAFCSESSSTSVDCTDPTTIPTGLSGSDAIASELSALNDTKRIYIKDDTKAPSDCDANTNDFIKIDIDAIDTSEDNPARIVVDGDVAIGSAGNSATFYGVVIAKKVKVTAGFNWVGGIVATECMDFGGGGVSFELSKTVLNNTVSKPQQVYVASSWKDWE